MGLNAQVRSQTSEQDEASFERRRRQLLGESWGMLPPPQKKKNLKSRGSETWNELTSWKRFPSIYPPYISWFYLNQSNFFQGLFSQLNVSSKKKRLKSRRGNCPVLPHASYGPDAKIHNNFKVECENNVKSDLVISFIVLQITDR